MYLQGGLNTLIREKVFYKDYEELFIKNTKLSKENKDLKYLKRVEESNKKIKEKIKEQQKKIETMEYEIARLKALLNIGGTNHGIPTSQTPINKTKVIPNTREKSEVNTSLRVLLRRICVPYGHNLPFKSVRILSGAI